MEFDIPLDLTVQGLKDKISDEYPNLKESMKSVLITINREYAFDEAVIPPNAEIALFPPVSGGSYPHKERVDHTPLRTAA